MPNPYGRIDSVETHDAKSLRQIVVTVRNLLAPAIRLAGDPDDAKSSGAMQSAGVKQLEISYIQSLERAMKELSRWGSACESAWSKTLIHQSAAAPVKSGKKTAKKKAKKR